MSMDYCINTFGSARAPNRKSSISKTTTFQLLSSCSNTDVFFDTLTCFLRRVICIALFLFGIGLMILTIFYSFSLKSQSYDTRFNKFPPASNEVLIFNTKTMQDMLRVPSAVKAEALAAAKKAKFLKAQNKTKKALKLYQHALTLYPSHEDILFSFGEFLEQQVCDVVRADHMYRKALQLRPDHSRALQSIRRTLPLVEEIDQKAFNRIDEKLQRLHRVHRSNSGLAAAIRESYYAYIQHSAAIEGNTLSLPQVRSLLDTGLAIGGKSIVEHNEIMGLASALDYVNTSLSRRPGPLRWDDILQLHLRVYGQVEPARAGRVRTGPVVVGRFEPPSAAELSAMLAEMMEWYNSPDASELHAIELAALLHYRFVYIHPFWDGNGRTARLLVSLVFSRFGLPPVIIYLHQRPAYFRALQLANDGDVRPFIRFVAAAAEHSLELCLRAADEGVAVSTGHWENQWSTQHGSVSDHCIRITGEPCS